MGRDDMVFPPKMSVMDEPYIVSRKMVDMGDGTVQITETVDLRNPDCPFVLTTYDDHGFHIEDKKIVKSASRTIIMHKRLI